MDTHPVAQPEVPVTYHRPGSEIVAILLAVGIATSLNVITFVAIAAGVWSALHNTPIPGGIGENVTQVLTGWGGGIIGVLGAYVGYTFGVKRGIKDQPPEPSELPHGGGEVMIVLILLGTVVAGAALGLAGVYWSLGHAPDTHEGLGPLF